MTSSFPVETLRAEIVGYRFPPGSLQVEAYENWLACDAFRSPHNSDDLLHPAWIVMGGFRAMGVSLAELNKLLRASEADGVMFGETTLEQIEQLRVGETYSVMGEIVDVVRRTGSRLGAFDLITFSLRLADHKGRVVAASSNTFVVPRR